jgi:phytol kinase
LNLALEIGVVVLWLTSLSLLQRLLNQLIQANRITPFTARKVAHVVSGFLILPLAAFVRHWYIAAIPITMILASNTKANLTRARLGETGRRLFPVVTCAAPVALILYFWSRERTDLVVLAVLTMSIGDTAAALVGMRFGKHRISWTGKTWEGALANFAASLATLAAAGHWLYQMPVRAFFLPAVAASILEAVLPGEWDNPLAIMLVLILLQYSV